jgi:hypothetical protein
MVNRVVFFPVWLLTIMACVLAAQTPAPPKTEQKLIIVHAERNWTATDFLVAPADQITFRASGRIYFNEGSNSAVGPSGWEGNYKADWPEDAAACADPLPAEPHGCMLARVDNEVFKVGSSLIISGKSGRLSVGINDCTWTGKLGNRGTFGANIKVVRDAVPVKK